MLPVLADLLRVLLLASALGGVAYLVAAVVRVAVFSRRRPAPPPSSLPPATVLKPLCGVEPGLRENLRSFCDQDYPAFQVLFGVREAGDPAIPVVREVIREFPGLDASLVVGEGVAAENLKIGNLLSMLPGARHDLLVIADSDMRVDQNYLRAVAASFEDPDVGAATCLYSGTPGPGLPSALGALFLNDWFLPSVLVALSFQKLRFCFGATMAVRREALEAIGGMESLAPFLADDYVLGERVSGCGYRVLLCPYVVEAIVSEPGFRSLLSHELRWARTIRVLRPAGYAFSFLGSGAISMAGLYLAASGSGPLGAALFSAAIGLRILLHFAVRTAVRVPGPPSPWLLLPRDLLCLTIWGAGFLGRGVRWKKSSFSVRPDGRLAARDMGKRHEDPLS